MQLRMSRECRFVASGAVTFGVGVRWNFELPVVVLLPRRDDELDYDEDSITYMIELHATCL